MNRRGFIKSPVGATIAGAIGAVIPSSVLAKSIASKEVVISVDKNRAFMSIDGGPKEEIRSFVINVHHEGSDVRYIHG